MKRTSTLTWLAMTAGTLVFGIGAMQAQGQTQTQPQSTPLGDYARNVRKNRPEPTSATRHYDNDNLPTTEPLSVVGPEPSVAPTAPATEAKTTAAVKPDQKKPGDDLQEKMDTEKQKIESLSRDLDMEEREYRLRASEYYANAANRAQGSNQWVKDDAQYKSDIESKQKAIESSKELLSELQEQARKAGLKQKEDGDKDANKNGNKETTKDQDSNKQ